MFTLFLVLTGLGAACMITGFTWLLVTSGQTRRRSGPEVGAETMAGQMGDEGEELASGTVFKGTGVAVSREAEYSYAEIKRLIRERRPEAIPLLLAAGGLLGFVLFGAFALWFGIEDKVMGTLIVLVVLFTVGRIAMGIART